MSKAKAVWELTRLEHGLMLGVAVLTGALIAAGELPAAWNFALAFLTALLIEASTFALNDYYDFEIDKANGRTDRPLVRGDLAKRDALLVFAALFPLGIICSFLVNWTCFLIALASAVLAVAYDAGMKRFKPLGNLYIAYTMAVPFVFGAAAVVDGSGLDLNLSTPVLILASVAFLAGAGREAMKDAEDVTGDSKSGVKSYATILGPRRALAVAAEFYCIAVALAFVPFLSSNFGSYYNNIYYILPVLVTDAMLLFTVASILSKPEPDLKFHRRLTLAALLVGLVGFLMGAFVG
ncbi:MAG: UbiA family prenyltransferase [Methanobacteriota archaeon]